MLICFLPICNLFSAASVHLFLWTGGKERLFHSVTEKKSPLVKDKPEEKEQCFFLVAGEGRRWPVGILQTHDVSFRQVPAKLQTHTGLPLCSLAWENGWRFESYSASS